MKRYFTWCGLAVALLSAGCGKHGEETAAPDVSTVEEEELSALMGEKEDYNAADEATEEDWED